VTCWWKWCDMLMKIVWRVVCTKLTWC